MMKTFDEYIQGRILKAYYNGAPGEGIYDNFYELALGFKYDSIDNITEYMLRYGCGKGRAKDYANYIVAYLEEQKEQRVHSDVCCVYEPKEAAPAEQSHLTDKDAKKLRLLIARYVNTNSQDLDKNYVNLMRFITSLKGE